jgi:hypothetical protein
VLKAAWATGGTISSGTIWTTINPRLAEGTVGPGASCFASAKAAWRPLAITRWTAGTALSEA